jgi:hypothetical protein
MTFIIMIRSYFCLYLKLSNFLFYYLYRLEGVYNTESLIKFFHNCISQKYFFIVESLKSLKAFCNYFILAPIFYLKKLLYISKSGFCANLIKNSWSYFELNCTPIKKIIYLSWWHYMKLQISWRPKRLIYPK